MKNLIKILLPVLLLGMIVACGGETKGEKVETSAAKEEVAKSTAAAKNYAVDTKASSIIWTGSKPTGTHQGKLSISNGSLAVKNGNIEAGTFTLDMKSITVTDLEAGKGKEDLEGHLKNNDFFEVEKYPAGKFVITNVATASGDSNITHNITGNLTIKDTTKSVTLPANVAMVGNKVTAVTPAFKINRTEWGINFHSGILGTAKDKLINDDISLVVNLVASAK